MFKYYDKLSLIGGEQLGGNMDNIKSFELFIKNLSVKKEFDKDNPEHIESAQIIHGSVKVVNDIADINWTYKSSNLALLVWEFMDNDMSIQEMASETFTDGAVTIFYNLSDFHFYAVVVK